MAVQFSNAQLTFDPVTKLYHCTYTVTGNGQDPNATTATGVGDSEYQAKRHAIVTYVGLYPKVFLGIDETALASSTVTINSGLMAE